MVPEKDASFNVGQIYDQLSEYEWGRLARHRTEFAIGLRVFTKYLATGPANILDIGGGPGRYSIALHQLGHSVVLADLSRGNL
jgi:S-adenosylmethionine-dependent methyltransferase